MKQLLAITATIFAFALSVQAQDFDPPTITMTAPVGGVALFTDRVTVTGEASATATDGTIKRVQYRIEGSRRWRNAILTNPDSATTSYVFSYKNKKKGRARRVYVRAIDNLKGESDIIGRKIYRSRANRAPVTTTAAASPSPTPTTNVGTPARGASVSATSLSASEWLAERDTSSATSWLSSLESAERAAEWARARRQ